MEQVRSKYKSPTYVVRPIEVIDIVTQEKNPNILSDKAFSALQISIFNSGYFMPIVISKNNEYVENDLDPITKLKLSLYNSFDDSKMEEHGGETERNKGRYSTEVSNKEIRKNFKYKIIDRNTKKLNC